MSLFGNILKDVGVLQEDLFNGELDEFSADDKKDEKGIAAKKAAETRRQNKEKKNKELNDLHIKAFSKGDLFGNEISHEEQQDALSKLKSLKGRKK